MTEPYVHLDNLIDQLPDIPPDSIVSRTLVSHERIKLILFGFAPGQELSEHTSSRPTILHFLAGEASVTLGGDALEAGPGAWMHLPPGLPHSIHARTQVVMLLYLL